MVAGTVVTTIVAAMFVLGAAVIYTFIIIGFVKAIRKL